MKTKEKLFGNVSKFKIYQKVVSVCIVIVLSFVILQAPLASFVGDRNDFGNEKPETAIATADEVREVLSQETLEKAGIKLYASQEEYLAEQQVLGQQLMSELNTYINTPVWHTFKVLDQKTNEPIVGALIIIDGEPRFSDVNGQISLTVATEVIELRVEKGGYNPYVEYYDVDAANEKGITTKTIFLKNPSNDLEIYNATLEYFGEKANVVQQNYTFDKTESEDDTFDITVEADADAYFLTVNGKDYTSTTGEFNDIEVSQLCTATNSMIGPTSPNEVELSISKNGVVSEKVPIKIGIVELSDLEASEYLGINISDKLEYESPFLGKFEISFLEALGSQLNINGKEMNLPGFSVKVVHNNLLGTYDFSFGVDLNIYNKSSGTSSEEVKEEYFKEKRRVMNTFKKSYRMRRNNPNPNASSQSVCQAMFGAFKTVKQTYGNPIKLIGEKNDFNVYLNIVAHIELSEKVFTGEIEDARQAVFSGGIDIEVSAQLTTTKHFTLTAGFVVIPLYVQVTMGGGLNVIYEYDRASSLTHALYLILRLNLGLDVGVGIKDILSAGIYGKGEVELWGELFSGEDGVNVYLSFGVIITVVGFVIDYKIVDEVPVISTNTTLALLADEDEGNSDSTYLDARPQSVYLGDEKLSVWLEKADTRDAYNKTRLMYSYGDITQAVLDDGKTDFYPELTVIDGEAYLVWHKSTAIFDGETTLHEAFEQSKIVVSKFDEVTSEFQTVTEFNDNTMHTLPIFAKNSTQDKFAVAWLSNSEGNPFGNSGMNKIYYAENVNGQWSAPQMMYSTNKAVSSYDIAYIDGNVNLVCVVDTDGNVATDDDTDLYYGSIGNMQNMTDDDVMQAAPQFGSYLGQTVLYYYEGNCLYMRNLDNGQETCVMQDAGFSGRYELLDGYTNQILYTRQSIDGVEICLASYDGDSSQWVGGQNMMVQNKYADFSACLNGNDIEIIGITYEEKSVGDGIIVGEISQESLSVNSDVELVEAYMLDTVKIGTNKIYCNIKNNGATNIENVDIYINNEKYSLTLEDVLLPGEQTVVNVDYDLDIIVDELNVVAVITEDVDASNNSFVIDVDYADIEMSAIQRLVNGKEIIDLKISNKGYQSESVDIVIRKGTEDGAVIYSEENISISAGAIVEREISIDYFVAGCQKGEKLYIEVVSDRNMAVDCNATIMISEDVKNYTRDEATEIQNLLTTAQKLLGVII